MPNVTETYTKVEDVASPSISMKHTMASHGPNSEVTFQDIANDLPTDPAELELAKEEASLTIVKELRASPEWQEVEAYSYLSDAAKEQSLTATTLRASGLIHRRPLKFYNHDKTECIIIAHLGSNLCGHQGIIHGGLLATLLDEHLAYVTLPHLPNFTGFTANLNIDYRLPVKSNQWVLIRGKLDQVEGRKAWADASIEHVETGIKMTEGRALYISPRVPIVAKN